MRTILFASFLLLLWSPFGLVPFPLLAQGWLPQSSGTANYLKSVFFIDANTGWAVGYGGTILHTTDVGTTWTAQISGTSNYFSSVFFIDASTGWVVGDVGTIHHTTDHGTTWAAQTSGTTQYLNSVFFIDGNTGWIAGTAGTIRHTTNGGTSWTGQSAGTQVGLNSVFFIAPNAGWISGGFDAVTPAVILRTADGTNWTNHSAGDYNKLNSVHFINPDTGWVVGSPGTIYYTLNGGIDWTLARSNSPPLESVFFSEPNRGYTVGWVGTILSTTNGGNTWRTQKSGTSNHLYSVHFIDDNTGWAVGGSGTILHTTTGGTGIEPPPPPTLASPANGSTVSTSPLLRWNTAPGALWYTLQVSTSPYFITKVVNQTDITSTSYQVTGLQSDTTYYWRVSMTNDSSSSGYSDIWSFTTAAFPNQVVLISPDDDQIVTSDSVVLVWQQSAPEVDRYWLEGSTDSLFSMSFVDSLVTDTTQTVNLLDHNETYWWKVKAHNFLGWGVFSEVRSFLVYLEIPAPPVPIFPDSGTVGVSTSPTLSWNPSIGTEWYTVQLSGTADFSVLIVDEDSIGGSSSDVTGLSNNTMYYWRVSATNGLGTSDWSEVWSFTTLVTVVEEDVRIPTAYTLSQNYPNPFNPNTTIKFALPEKAHVKLEVFNMLGQSVAVLVDGEQAAGYHSAVFEGSRLSSGVYIYRLSTTSFVQTKRLVLIR